MKITMAYGGGGVETTRLISEVFAKHFKNPVLTRMEDSAALDVSNRIAFTTDSFVVTPLFFNGGDIGRLAVCGTVNDLLMVGARPRYLSCGFIIEEGCEFDDLERVAKSMRECADEAGVSIVAGDTKVVEGHGGLFINTSGIGDLAGDEVSVSQGKAGDAVLLSGNIGDHHACILSRRMGIENNIASDAAPLGEVVAALCADGTPVRGMRDVTRGGLATILNEIAAASGTRVELDELSLPVADDVRGLCDILGLDPLYMGNEGKLVAIVPADCAEAALARVRETKYGRDAAIIGRLTEGSGVAIKTKLGGLRTVSPLRGEGLPRIC